MLYIVFNTSVVLDILYSLNLHINQPFREDTDKQRYRDTGIYIEYRVIYRIQWFI